MSTLGQWTTSSSPLLFSSLPLFPYIQAIVEEKDATVAELITLEDPVDRCGGVVLPLSYIQSISALARENNLKLHLDGSRIWNVSK